jgi:hypothetical protein
MGIRPRRHAPGLVIINLGDAIEILVMRPDAGHCMPTLSLPIGNLGGDGRVSESSV